MRGGTGLSTGPVTLTLLADSDRHSDRHSDRPVGIRVTSLVDSPVSLERLIVSSNEAPMISPRGSDPFDSASSYIPFVVFHLDFSPRPSQTYLFKAILDFGPFHRKKSWTEDRIQHHLTPDNKEAGLSSRPVCQ